GQARDAQGVVRPAGGHPRDHRPRDRRRDRLRAARRHADLGRLAGHGSRADRARWRQPELEGDRSAGDSHALAGCRSRRRPGQGPRTRRVTLQIPLEVARRFILGKQGLWPGRRWRGLDGAEQAMRAIEHLQLDPLVVIARAHDLILHSRVIDYRQGDWATLTYEQRKFFDWGGWLAVRPMNELPYWRVLMRREVDQPNWVEFAKE